jgi:hypothetical protein
VYQQQQQQQEQEEQDAENPFLDPPFSRIKIFGLRTLAHEIRVHITVSHAPLKPEQGFFR